MTEGVNLFKVHCTHLWNYHNETTPLVILMHTNKTEEKGICPRCHLFLLDLLVSPWSYWSMKDTLAGALDLNATSQPLLVAKKTLFVLAALPSAPFFMHPFLLWVLPLYMTLPEKRGKVSLALRFPKTILQVLSSPFL
jgi:hypothetical protein